MPNDLLIETLAVGPMEGCCYIIADPATREAAVIDPGGIGLYCAEQRVCFTGDTLFAGGIGRSDFPGGDGEQLLDSIRNRLLTLDDDTKLYPGHGPATTVGDEKAINPYL